MKQRLLRALQNGGCIAQIRGRDWGVWRQHDLRGRAIGVLDLSEVEALRVSGELKQLGSGEPQKLIWSGGFDVVAAVSPSAGAILVVSEQKNSGAALLDRVVAEIEDERQQRRIAQAAIDYAEDIERSFTGGASGMNWSAISAGVRIEGGKSRDHYGTTQNAARASERLARVSENLGAYKQRFLHVLVVDRVTRHAAGRLFSMPVAHAETTARDVLVELADIYDCDVKRPERAQRRFV